MEVRTDNCCDKSSSVSCSPAFPAKITKTSPAVARTLDAVRTGTSASDSTEHERVVIHNESMYNAPPARVLV